MSEHLKKADTEHFDADVIHNPRPVLVDFYADWCGPCQSLAPVVAGLAEDYADRVAVRKVDVDTAGELAGRYGVRSIPTVMLFQDGEVVATHIGAASKSALAQLLERHLADVAER